MIKKIKKPFYFVEFNDGVFSVRNNDNFVLFRSRTIFDILEVLIIWCEISDFKRIQFTGLTPADSHLVNTLRDSFFEM